MYFANDKKYAKLLGMDFSWLRKTKWNWTISFMYRPVQLNEENWTIKTAETEEMQFNHLILNFK